jgi:molybdopterin-guanine dinucleotide biosynthesis protein
MCGRKVMHSAVTPPKKSGRRRLPAGTTTVRQLVQKSTKEGVHPLFAAVSLHRHTLQDTLQDRPDSWPLTKGSVSGSETVGCRAGCTFVQR